MFFPPMFFKYLDSDFRLRALYNSGWLLGAAKAVSSFVDLSFICFVRGMVRPSFPAARSSGRMVEQLNADWMLLRWKEGYG